MSLFPTLVGNGGTGRTRGYSEEDEEHDANPVRRDIAEKHDLSDITGEEHGGM